MKNLQIFVFSLIVFALPLALGNNYY